MAPRPRRCSPAPEALKAVSPAAREEILTLFPELASPEHIPASARLLPSGRMGRKLASRHLKKRRPLVDARLSEGATEK